MVVLKVAILGIVFLGLDHGFNDLFGLDRSEMSFFMLTKYFDDCCWASWMD